MKRTILLLALVFWAPAVFARETPPKRPNVLLVVTDDQGYGDASCFWEKTDLKTPTTDGIAAQGVRFTRFRVNPLCAPTRSSLLTGLYSIENGMWRGPDRPDKETKTRRLREEVLLLPHYLRKAGYATGIFGKWHLGYDDRNVPNARGFDTFVGFLGGSHPYHPRRNARLLRDGKPLAAEKHTTDLFADEADRFLRANRDRPFFCYLAFNAVHGPLRSPDRPSDSGKPEWLARYEKAGVAQPRRDYCAVMGHADARIGDLLKTLGELGLERRTLVILLSDNGGILEKYPSNNGSFRGGKGQTYEGGIRVPAVMRWPGVIPPGMVSEADAAHFDVFATVLDAAGVGVPKKNGLFAVSGVSLLPHLRSGGKEALPDRHLFWDLYGKQAALHGRWKLVGELPNHRGDFRRAVADAREARYQLFDLREDPGEKRDVAGEHPEVYEDLKRRHVEWLGRAAK